MNTKVNYNPNFNEICGSSDNIEEYGRFQQHLGLLEDTVRVGSYYNAILASADNSRKVAVDIGGGTGVLTLMAIRCGYEKVYYIEPSKKIADYARYNFIKNGTLESIDLSAIKEPIDLIVTETISTLFLGFGCWDKFNELRNKLSEIGTTIPYKGVVKGLMCDRDFSIRNDKNHGLKLLENIGVDIDLYKRTFRSGGNVYEKGQANFHLLKNTENTIDLVKIDSTSKDYCFPVKANLISPRNVKISGLLTYWEIQLSEFSPAVFDSRDPLLTSWMPYFIPFNEITYFEEGENLSISVNVLQCDSPYPYAFQVLNHEKALTNTLYW